LILFGTSYTQLPPIPSSDEGSDASGQLTIASRDRIHALGQALLKPGENERIRFASDFLARHSVAPSVVNSYLTANLQRMILEERTYEFKQQEARKTGDPDALLMTRATIYKERGLSFDTSLEPDYALDTMLRQLAGKGLTPRGGIRRIAVMGPGLDFADKRIGLDFYPIQTIQPFAIMESVLRLKLGSPETVRVVAFDLNPAVLAHIERLAARGRAGSPYVVQLPNDSRNGWPPELISYWQHFGDVLGTPTRPFGPPGFFKGVNVRAVAIRPQLAVHVSGQDLNMVAQQLEVAPGGGFDLVIATNIFVYYNFFEQALAMQNISHMLNPGGIFLVNQILSNQHPDSLKLIDQCNGGVPAAIGGQREPKKQAYKRNTP
jgi:SAM-dependent methyltransferase